MPFRYPVDRHGKPMLPSDIKRLDVLHFAEQMEGIASWLEATESMPDAQADASAELAEIEAQLSAEYQAEHQVDNW